MVGESEVKSEGESVGWVCYSRWKWLESGLGSRGSRGVTWLHTSARCRACEPHHDADQDYHSAQDEVLQRMYIF